MPIYIVVIVLVLCLQLAYGTNVNLVHFYLFVLLKLTAQPTHSYVLELSIYIMVVIGLDSLWQLAQSICVYAFLAQLFSEFLM